MMKAPEDALKNPSSTTFDNISIPVGSRPTLEDALDKALEKGGGNVMVDAVVESYWQTYLLFNRSGVRVKGKVVNIQ